MLLKYLASFWNISSPPTLWTIADFNVEANEDGSFTVYINEEVNTSDVTPAQAGERPAKKQRRSKAQIEADNKAEAERKANSELAGTTASGNAVESTEKPTVEAASAVAVVVGETTPEASGDGEAQQETTADPIVETAVVVETKPEVEPDSTPEVEPERKPTTSLFANLRKPNNQ